MAFSGLWASGTSVVHPHTCRQDTHAQKKKKNEKNQRVYNRMADRCIHTPSLAPTSSLTLSNIFYPFYAWVTFVRMQMTEQSPNIVVKIKQVESYVQWVPRQD